MITGESIVGRRERVIVQQVEGDSVLLDIDSGAYFTLNPVGSLVWERCDGSATVSTIVSAVCDEFDQSPQSRPARQSAARSACVTKDRHQFESLGV